MAGRLLMFTAVLGIGWYRLLKYFFLSPLILRNVEYGQGGKYRNVMDIYLPAPHNPSVKSQPRQADSKGNNSNSVPVVIFVSGGAWIIGYKLWSALVARGLSHLGLVCIVPDYRNFPQGDIEDMMADIRAAIEWTTYNASRFGGDSSKIVLAGQSAGAHICTCLMVDDFLRAKNGHQYYGTTPAAMTGNTVLVPVPVAVSPIVSSSSSPSLAALSGDSGELVSSPSGPLVPTESADSLAGFHILDNNSSSNNSINTSRDLLVEIPVSLSSGCIAAEAPAAPAIAAASQPAPSNTTETETEADITPHFNALEHIKLFIGVSGPYNLFALVAHLRDRGLDPSILQYVCRGDIVKYSPTIQLHDYSLAAADKLRAEAQQLRLKAEQESASSLAQQQSEPLSTLSTLISLVDSITGDGHGSYVDMFDREGDDGVEEEEEGGNSSPRTTEASAQDTASASENNARAGLTPSPSDGVYVDESQRTSPIGVGGVANRSPTRLTEFALQSANQPSNKSNSSTSKANDNTSDASKQTVESAQTTSSSTAASKTHPTVRPFYAYYLPHIHSFFADVESSTIAEMNNYTSLPSSQAMTTAISGQHSDKHPFQNNNNASPALDTLSTVAQGSGSVNNYQQKQQQSSATPAVVPMDHLSSFPPVVLIHGSKDKSIPLSNCSDLYDVLRINGATVDMKIYNHWSHTDAIVEAPLSGNMRLFYDMVDCIETHTNNTNDDSDEGEHDEDGGSGVVPVDLRREEANVSSTVAVPPTTPHKGTGRARRDSAELFYDEGSNAGHHRNNGRKQLDIMVPRVLVNIARKINPF